MYQTIFVPLDGSEFSARALPVAAALARRTGARLVLAVVFDPSMFLRFTPGEATVPSFDQQLVERQCNQARAWVEEQAASIANTGLAATGVLLEGTIVEALAEHALAINADIVVMTTHGRSGVNRLWLGSVAGTYIARSLAPVFLVRPSGHDAPTPGHELPTGRLLVPLDGSAFAESAIPHAVQFAAALGLDIELVSVVTPVAAPMALFGEDALVVDERLIASQEQASATYLSAVAAGMEPHPVTTQLSSMIAASALIDYAGASNPGAIALATHGRSGLARVMLGSVADKLLRGIEQPLLVFHPPEHAAIPSMPKSAS